MSDAPERLKGYALALLAAVCWGTGGLTAKWLFTAPSAATANWPLHPLGLAIEPAALSSGRALAAFLILITYLALRRPADLKINPRHWWFFVVFGVVGMAGVHFTYFKAISLTNVATAILLEYLAPILVLIVSVAFLKHKLTWQLPAGVALSVIGCALVVGAIGGEGMAVSPAGVAWGLGSAVFFAAYSLLGTWAASRYSPFTTLVYGLGAASAFWLVTLGFGPIVYIVGNPRLFAAVIFMAIFSTVIPFTAFLMALRHIPPTNATITSTLEPVVAGVGAFVLFGEALTLIQLLGGALVVVAIAVVQLPDRDTAPTLPPYD
ncbi:MAG TPA: EamA family transporter [Coriobacteriia bacterium]|nr:EamA family transporter [Coriobacteriia bacterium]